MTVDAVAQSNLQKEVTVPMESVRPITRADISGEMLILLAMN